MTKNLLLDVKNLSLRVGIREGVIRATEGATFQIEKGRVLGVVGESGSGKSFTAKALLRIEKPAQIHSGEITYYRSDEAIRIDQLDLKGQEVRKLRWGSIAMIFQEPMSSLGPMHTIGAQIAEAVILHRKLDKSGAMEVALQALTSVGMPRPAEVLRQYPHQMSGGMRQRAMIAMALSCQPGLLVADEPTTALDVTTEAQILELIDEQRRTSDMSVLFISHNLAVIAQVADDVMVMYLGRIVEKASVEDLFERPHHPYTQALLRSIPSVDMDPTGRLATIEGAVPDALSVPPGCPFHPRCPDAMPGLCDRVVPVDTRLGPRHIVSCHLHAGSDAAQAKQGAKP
jgi:peptide/nickel transport system ATP-binding protein